MKYRAVMIDKGDGDVIYTAEVKHWYSRWRELGRDRYLLGAYDSWFERGEFGTLEEAKECLSEYRQRKTRKVERTPIEVDL